MPLSGALAIDYLKMKVGKKLNSYFPSFVTKNISATIFLKLKWKYLCRKNTTNGNRFVHIYRLCTELFLAAVTFWRVTLPHNRHRNLRHLHQGRRHDGGRHRTPVRQPSSCLYQIPGPGEKIRLQGKFWDNRIWSNVWLNNVQSSFRSRFHSWKSPCGYILWLRSVTFSSWFWIDSHFTVSVNINSVPVLISSLQVLKIA